MTRLDLSPTARSYLIGAGVGAAVGLVLLAAPFVPWRVAGVTAVALAAATVVFARSLVDPDFLRPDRDVSPWAGVPDTREPAPPRVRLRLRRPGETRDDIPAAHLLVASRRAGAR